MTKYVGLVRKDPGSDYSVDFPDFPGCITAGPTYAEARALAAEALQFHVDGLIEDHDHIPAPTPRGVLMADTYNQDALPIEVEVNVADRPVPAFARHNR